MKTIKFKEYVVRHNTIMYYTLSEYQDYMHIDGNIICEFTGLQDENGVDIYEGDNVTYYNPHSKETYNHIVKWSDDFACFALYEKGNEFVKEFDWFKIENIEVIGNIHQP